MTSAFTCIQLADYCRLYNFWVPLGDRMQGSVDYIHIIFGIIGLPCYIIMFMMFRLKAYDSVSFTYHRATVYMEMVHMIVSIQVTT